MEDSNLSEYLMVMEKVQKISTHDSYNPTVVDMAWLARAILELQKGVQKIVDTMPQPILYRSDDGL